MSAGNGDSKNANLSADDQYLIFESDATDLVDDAFSQFSIYKKNIIENSTGLVSLTNTGGSLNRDAFNASISEDGRYVIFESFGNFTDDDPQLYTRRDVFLRDTLNSTTKLLTGTRTGIEDNFDAGQSSLSNDGRYVTFTSESSRFIDNDDIVEMVYLVNTITNQLTPVSLQQNGEFPDSG